MHFHQHINTWIPPSSAVRERLGNALREVELLRSLLRLAERMEQFDKYDQYALEREKAHAS